MVYYDSPFSSRSFAAHYLVSQKKTTPTDIPHFETVIEEVYSIRFFLLNRNTKDLSSDS